MTKIRREGDAKMTRFRRKTAVILSAICLTGAVISTGCDVESDTKPLRDWATKCPDFDEYTANSCLRRVCTTSRSHRARAGDCKRYYQHKGEIREANRRENDANPEGK